jgi:uncharacterized protein (TIGR03083 family)
VDGRDVLAAAEMCRAMLEPHVDEDWSAPVPDLEFTVASVLAHVTQAMVWYPLDLWGGPEENAALTVEVRTDAGNGNLLAGLGAGARVCAAAIDAAPADLRGFHGFGSPDPSGFAAMACDELLVHGNDAARGLGLRLAPGPDLAGAVLARLFPWHAPGEDHWQTLLWANGRIDIEGRPMQQRWRWHSAPLAEWDGRAPGTKA